MNPFGRLFGRDDPHSLAAPYALDALEPEERRRFEKHLRRCERCAAEVRALSEDAVRLAWSTSAPAPPAMRDRVLAAVRATPQEPPAPGRDAPAARAPHLPPHVWGTAPPPARARAPRLRPLFGPLATATAAAALVVAALIAVQAARTQDTLDAERAQAREIAHVLAAPDARAAADRDARGRGLSVIASASQGRAVVTLSGTGALPDTRVHQLWLMRPGAPPRSLGLFEDDTPLVADGLATSATSLAVTVEPDGGSVRPTSAPLVQLALDSVGFGE
ncbi:MULTISPECIES: anti-sigma factor domain-containing protein [Streptomyces]|uniref:Regulator of SigK n=2 Tax=Streptomyces TaxID=1883 RepID=A0A7W2DQU7_9ACTN|nr:MULTISPECIES: anti-sigma factor [Streptomyces]MBA5221313.1 anti-sigma factor [Streptomyces griseoaurantiacus]MDX3360265.1 anti-sigma factor [Streptomyces sp. ME02-6978.2a]NJP72623.1 anti-sigma factor [Streptomyces sp. C1-2]